MDFWDRMENERSLTVEETELKKRIKRKLQKVGASGGNSLETTFKGDLAKGGG